MFNKTGQHIFAGDDRGVIHVILTETMEVHHTQGIGCTILRVRDALYQNMKGGYPDGSCGSCHV